MRLAPLVGGLLLVAAPASAQGLAGYIDSTTREKVTVETAKPLPTSQTGTFLTDRSVVMSAAQAAGTAPVIAANPSRHIVIFVPLADCKWTLAPGASGPPMLGGFRSALIGVEAPTNAIYAPGCAAAGQTLTILEG